MFGRKRGKSLELNKLTSLVADNVNVAGDLVFSGGLRIDGKVEGNVRNRDGERTLLVLSDKGSITGRVKVYDAVVNGVIEGDLEVEHFLELQAGARIRGNIVYRQLQMECGATVEGKLEKTDETGEDANVVPLTAVAAR